jgi:hypothetical protein
MQLCQTTEVVTDVGEIRLPEEFSTAHAASSANFMGAPDQTRSAANSTTASLDGSSLDGSSRPTSSSAKASAGTDTEERVEEEEKVVQKMHFSSIISELFQGRMVSVVRCLDCQKSSRTEEVVYDVSIPIPNTNELPTNGPSSGGGDLSPLGVVQQQMQMATGSKGVSGPSWTGVFGGLPGKVKSWFYDKGVEVSDCLRKHCAPELLSGKDRYFCEHCKRKCDCEKKIAFKELPEVLCIHLKRFRYDGSWFNGTKNSKVVNFPVGKSLDMNSFLDSPGPQPVEYKLIGLIQHIGSMGAGHYISYCQHKRKPNDWYEFDDLQVNLVSTDHVERAEPYVLFYQRCPSKGSKVDRQNFKNEQRRLNSMIRSYISTLQASSPSGSRSSKALGEGGDDAGASSAATAAASGSAGGGDSQISADDIGQHHGPALRNLYRNPPAELDVVFVSKHWYVRLAAMSQPGPIDNFEYLCPHKLLGSHSVEMAAEPFLPISRALFQSLVQKYGGGPEICSLEICSKCQTHLRAYNDRKQAEYDLVSKYDTKDTGEGKYWYLVDALWVNTWKSYVRAEHVTDIRDMCAPGRITNARLFDKDNPGKIRQNLRLRNDYIGVNARVWWLFMHVHGGGPAICTEDLEIYSVECPPETELFLEELRGTGPGAIDFSRRVSYQLVDDCHGDLALYEQRFGAAIRAAAATQESSLAQAATTTQPVACSDVEMNDGDAALPSRGSPVFCGGSPSVISGADVAMTDMAEAGQYARDSATEPPI